MPVKHKKGQTLGTLIRKNMGAYVLALPFLILFTVFIVIPIIVTVLLSFFSYDLNGGFEFSGIENFQSLFSMGGEFSGAFLNSLLIFLAVGLGGFVLCFAAAWGIEFLNRKFADILTVLLFTVSLAGTAVSAVWLSGGLRSPLNSLLLGIGLSDVQADFLADERYALLCVILSGLWSSFGLGFLALRAGFRKIDREKADSARLEGVKNPLWILYYAEIPQLYPQILFASAIQISYAFTNSEILRILSGTSTEDFKAGGILTCIFGSSAELNTGAVCAANFILIAVMTAIYAVVRFVIGKFSKSV